MISCPVCQTQNHHLAVKCKSCGGYIQTKIENLDLFTTAWNVLERPGHAFHMIAVAQHKNYSVILPFISGVALTFFYFWVIKAGDATNSLLNFLAGGFVVSPFVGIITSLAIAVLLKLTVIATGRPVSFRNAFSVIAYTQVPLVISVVLVFPLELMTFGLYFFTTNPSPYQLKPVPYILLAGLDGLFAIWSLLLIWFGIRKLTDGGRLYSIFVYSVVMVIFSGIVFAVYHFVLSPGQ
jgi:hypothetical protein